MGMTAPRTRTRPAARLLTLLFAPLVAACGSERPPMEPSDAPPPPRLRDLTLEPMVILPGESFRLELTIQNAPETELDVGLRDVRGRELVVDGTPVPDPSRTFTTYDDGTHGDRTAGDGVFTRAGLTLENGAGIESLVVHGLHLEGTDPGEWQRVLLTFRSVSEPEPERPPVTDLGPDARATPRVVSLVDPAARNPTEGALAGLTRRYYELFPDDRDVLIVVRPPRYGSGPSGVAYRIRGWARGLGFEAGRPFDYGSPAALHVVVDTHRALRLVDAAVDGAFCLAIHELTHQWAAYTGPPLSDGTGHWDQAVLARDASGFGVDGVCRFNDVEAYLAGWIPPDSVTAPLTTDGYHITDVVAALGARVPAEGRRDFTLGVVVVHDRLLTPAELEYFDRVVREFTAATSTMGGLTWTQATGGRSTLDPLLPAPAPPPEPSG